MNPSFRIDQIDGSVLDIDGTLLRGNLPLPGFRRLFGFLHERQFPFALASNNATIGPAGYQLKLARLGAKVDLSCIITAGLATVDYLQKSLRSRAPLYVIGEAALRDPLLAAGFVVRTDASQPVDAVVVGGDATLTYRKLKDAALLLQRGADLVGTNPDLLCPTEEGLVPEAGTTLAALEAATGVAPTIIGKPERHLFDLAVKRLGTAPARTVVLGDRLVTDILGAQRAGLKAILITSGVDSESTIPGVGIQPDGVVSGLDAFVDLWTTRTEEQVR